MLTTDEKNLLRIALQDNGFINQVLAAMPAGSLPYDVSSYIGGLADEAVRELLRPYQTNSITSLTNNISQFQQRLVPQQQTLINSQTLLATIQAIVITPPPSSGSGAS